MVGYLPEHCPFCLSSKNQFITAEECTKQYEIVSMNMILEAQKWDQDLFEQTANMALKLSMEPSVKGMSRHLVLYGKKI